MDELILLEAIERYVSGEMTAQEKTFFEDLRKNNAEVDQMVVEHSYFLHGLEKHGALKSFRHTLHEVEAKLMEEGIIAEPKLTGKAKVVTLWNRYKRNIAVAASIAGFISILTTGINVAYNNRTRQNDLVQLKREIIESTQKVINNKVAQNKPRQIITETAKIGGTGFLIDGKGYLITNAHVISKMKNIYVENSKGDYFTAESIFTDNTSDLALLKITDTAYKAIANLPYSVKKTNIDLGEQFFTLGFPRNEIVYGEGYVSAKSGNDGDSSAYQLTVSANPGNSGGPVINRNGEIIGIITAKDSKADGVVYAAKSKNIFKMLDQLKKDDSTKYQSIKTSTSNDLKKLDRVQQIKRMEEFVFMVVGN